MPVDHGTVGSQLGLQALSAQALRAYVRYSPVQPGKEFLVRAFCRLTRGRDRDLMARTQFGGVLECRLRDFIQSRIFLFGTWEPNLTHLVSRTLSAGDVFLDVGANVGYYSLLAAKIVGATGLVIAVEASPSTFARLRRNVEINGMTNVHLMNVAATDRRGDATIYRGPPSNSGISTILASSGLPREADVRAVPFVELLTPEQRVRCRLVKIDVEGAEGPILKNLFEYMGEFSRNTEFVVELSPERLQPTFSGVAEVIDRFRASGCFAYRIENDYRFGAYRKNVPTICPRPFSGELKICQDILFSRRDVLAAR